MKRVIKAIVCIIIQLLLTFEFGIIVGKNKDRYIRRYKQYFKLMCKWEGVSNNELEAFFLSHSINTIGIYGKGEIGNILAKKLSNTKISVLFFVEKRKVYESAGIPTYSIEESLPIVDAIIVTPFTEFEKIKVELEKKVDYKIISVEEALINA